jgi:hypothetical protein
MVATVGYDGWVELRSRVAMMGAPGPPNNAWYNVRLIGRISFV